VVVAAPTGAGKTAIAEAAAIAVLARGQRVIYTTPLKVSLSAPSTDKSQVASHTITGGLAVCGPWQLAYLGSMHGAFWPCWLAGGPSAARIS